MKKGLLTFLFLINASGCYAATDLYKDDFTVEEYDGNWNFEQSIQLNEISSNPTAPLSNGIKIFAKDDGSGNTTLYTMTSGGTVSNIGSGSGGGSADLPATDTTAIVKGSADTSKRMRFEADGITTGTTRVYTLQDTDGTVYVSNGAVDVALADGGTGVSLSDPGADRIMFWDDSESAVDWLSLNTTLRTNGTELGLSSPVGIGDGGTEATTRQNAINNLTAATTSTVGYVLTVDGSNNAVFASNTSTLFSDTGSTVNLVSTDDNFVIGGTTPVSGSKFTVYGNDTKTTVSIKAGQNQSTKTLQVVDSVETTRFSVATDGTVRTIGSTTSGTIDIGSAGVTLTDDGDGALTITGAGDGSDEAVKFNLDDTSNTVGVSTSTGVTKWDMNQMVFIGQPRQLFSFNIQAPHATCDSVKIKMRAGGIITQVSSKIEGGTNVVGRIYEVDSDGDQSDQAGIDSADWTVTTTATDDVSFTNPQYDANDWLAWDTTSVSGSVNQLNVTVWGYDT